MKKIIIALLAMFAISTCAPHAGAVTINGPNGTQIELDALTEGERNAMIKYMDKIAKAKEASPELPDGVKEALGSTLTNPTKLDQWRKMITGTIKDICTDLNVGVNEFIKTPVGMMTAGILIYKFAGKDLLENALDIIIITPGWFLLMGLWLFFLRYFYGSKMVYDITEVTPEKGFKKEVRKTNGRKKLNYPWEHKSEAKVGLAWFMGIFPIVITLAATILVLP